MTSLKAGGAGDRAESYGRSRASRNPDRLYPLRAKDEGGSLKIGEHGRVIGRDPVVPLFPVVAIDLDRAQAPGDVRGRQEQVEPQPLIAREGSGPVVPPGV